jgi:type II secretory pathway predicted ATPase ExeA/cell division septation protein DedD
VSQHYPQVPFEGGRILRHLAADPLSAPPPATPFAPSLTYELYYGLKEKPFSLASDPRFLFRTPARASAFDDLLNGIRRREGLIVLSGDIGTGKTTLMRSVLQNLDRRTFSAVVPDPFVSREDLLKMLLVDFGVVSIADLKRGSLNGASRPDLSYPLYEFLDSLVPLQAFAVVIVDEAQNLPLPLLEEVRILSDLEGREKLLQVVLVGQPELRDNLKQPQMRQVDQRVSVRVELSPLALEDVAGYIRHRLNVAGDGDSRAEFSESAIDAVYRGSGGTPRLINKICDRALTRGFGLGISRIEADVVTDAIRDLEVDRRRGSVQTPASPLESSRSSALMSDAPPLSEFAAEEDAEEDRLRAVPIETPPAPSWKPVALSVLLSAIAVGAGAMLAFLYLQSNAADVSMLQLPPAPTRPAPPTLSTLGVPAAWMTPASGRPTSAAGIGVGALEKFAIQVASFNTLARAEVLVGELTRDGHRARAVALDYGPPRGQLVQVLVGEYRSFEEAQPDLTRLREQFADAQLERVIAR